ncbi:ArsR/SmtB family transcription factor [Phytoactinopolyspora mesophila]|uniref:Metalloregulator ArsR/SmtB family transcription factor n=1 Tax=Phytoactinopolyspora mesophila TaxID=2650750 RepID=A0A7K3MBJ1_9ACTN|nr:metalloregulator ArsR/SmtB family transcription factor [Phytoactinopolyspora mesophila]NDL60387.1 metalloregulator ArsR/SmtB family transcription factor [Phytoactinopolyspora mesophila]
MSTATIAPEASPDTHELPVIDTCCVPASTVGDDDAVSLARMFKALADPARVKILSLLLNADEVCACDMAEAIGKTAATTSHHLKLLKEAGLITGERRGTWIHYRVVPQRLAAIRDALTLGPS